MVTLGMAISHVDSEANRRAWVSEIRRECPAAVVVKDQRRNLWHTVRRTWLEALSHGHTHAVAMQDDMIPCPHFEALALSAIEARPDDAICYFSMRKALGDARASGDPIWLDTPDACWGGTTILPESMAYDFLAWERRHIARSYPWDDRRLSMYLISHDLRCYVTAPSLVQHEGNDSSLMGNQASVAGRERKSHWVADGSPIDWRAARVCRVAGTLDFDKEMLKASA